MKLWPGKYLLFVLVQLLISGCTATDSSHLRPVSDDNNPTAVNNQNLANSTSNEVHREKSDSGGDSFFIGDSIGIVTLGEKYKKENNMIIVNNQDGSEWYRFSFYYDDSDGEWDFPNDDFRPFGFHPDYFKLALKCIGISNGNYKVVVNEDTNLQKYVASDTGLLKLITWEEYLMEAFGIVFDDVKNQARFTKNGKPDSSLHLDKGHFRVVPKKIEGDWMQVSIEDDSDDTKKVRWIKWRDKGNLLVSFYSYA